MMNVISISFIMSVMSFPCFSLLMLYKILNKLFPVDVECHTVACSV